MIKWFFDSPHNFSLYRACDPVIIVMKMVLFLLSEFYSLFFLQSIVFLHENCMFIEWKTVCSIIRIRKLSFLIIMIKYIYILLFLIIKGRLKTLYKKKTHTGLKMKLIGNTVCVTTHVKNSIIVLKVFR